ncbi:alpha/beta hydrolase [Parasediminibacterium sp. JCM 36343]|uniref:alpha/beta hydrolase n=1 Tax=Parasediminibacterium sp. JCM 36343 TaxID=3374279 RepID=UPI00397A8ECC
MKLGKRIALRYYKTKFRLLGMVSPKEAAKRAFELFCTPYSGKPQRLEPGIFAKGEKITVKTEGGLILRGWRWQPEKPTGKTILILHGFDSCSYKFEKYIRPLKKEGYTVLAFDAPGHGLSDGKTINSLQYKKSILAVDKKFGPLYGIMAHSIGGLAASLASEKLPRLDKLVLIAPPVEITRSIDAFSKMLSLSKVVKKSLYKFVVKLGQRPVSYYNAGRAIQQITTPTLWVHDEEDKVCPYDEVKTIQELNLPHVSFYITKGLGHSNIYREPETVKTIVDFFKK